MLEHKRLAPRKRLGCGLTGAAASRNRNCRMPAPDLLSFAHALADAARRETLRHAPGTIAADDKSAAGEEFDPVTQADRDAERAMRALIARDYPDHGVIGEEFGDTPAAGPLEWVLDPIDGTRSFTCGLPSWTTLIALTEDGEPRIGIIDAPALDERYAGAPGECRLRARGSEAALRASGCTLLSEARLSTTDPYLFAGPAADSFDRLRRAVRTTRYGHDGYAYARLAAGSLDLVVECGLKRHDYAALIPVVRGAGGTFGDWRGGSDFAAGDVIAAATPGLYAAAVAIMGGAAPEARR